MLINEVPLDLGLRREFKKTWADGQSVEEVVYAFDRAALLRLEECMLRKTLQYWLEYVEGSPLFKAADLFQLQFFANEFAALDRLQLYQKLNPGRPLNRDRITGEFAFYVSRSQIPQALTIIRTP